MTCVVARSGHRGIGRGPGCWNFDTLHLQKREVDEDGWQVAVVFHDVESKAVRVSEGKN